MNYNKQNFGNRGQKEIEQIKQQQKIYHNRAAKINEFSSFEIVFIVMIVFISLIIKLLDFSFN